MSPDVVEGLLSRMDDLERALAVIVMRGDTDGPSTTTCCEHPVDNDNEPDPSNVEMLLARVGEVTVSVRMRIPAPPFAW